MSINSVNICGNLTRDCEVRTTSGGTNVVSFGVAVNERRKVNGEWQDYPNYIDCFAYLTDGQLAWQQRRLHKGAKVAVDGSLRYSSWETRDGKRRTKVEVFAQEIEFMQGDGGDDRQERQQPAQDDEVPADAYDADLPF